MKKKGRLIAFLLFSVLGKGILFAQATQLLAMDMAHIQPGMVVCEVGAGTGSFTLPLAKRIGPSGKIYAEDIDAKSLDILREKARNEGIHNIEIIRGTEIDPFLPQDTMDVVFVIAAFHDFTKKNEMLNGIAPSLKKEGRLVIMDPEIDRENPSRKKVLSREHFISIIEASPFRLENVDDTSFPKTGPERTVIYVLSLKDKDMQKKRGGQ